MSQIARMTGIKSVLAKLNKATDDYSRNIRRGLVKGGLHLQAKSQEIVPKQLGVLSASAFTRDIGNALHPDIIVGYTADYAVFVHEDLEKRHGQAFNQYYATEIANAEGTSSGTAKGGLFNRGENQQAKFLEKPARDERGAIFAIIQRESKF